jgi:hypothetical protein
MKFKNVTRRVAGTYTRDGVTIPRTREESVQVPALPRDFNAIALRVAVGVSLALTAAVIVWSTVKIGGLLHGGVGYVAAGIFDIGWLMALLLAYLSRYDESKRKFADRLGMWMLIATMGALFWAGMDAGSVAMGVVGAAVSLFAKAIWVGVMKHINADLSDDDRAWLAAQISDAQTKAAVAQVRRQTAKIEAAATIQMLAMEHEVAQVRTAFGLDTETTAVQTEVVESSPSLELEPPTLADLPQAEAIRFVRTQHPDLTAGEVAAVLADHGVDCKPAYVTQVIERSQKRESEPTNVVSISKEA